LVQAFSRAAHQAAGSMGAVPWYLERSYLASGWCRSDTYSVTLPDLREPRSGCSTFTTTPKELRPRSALERYPRTRDPALSASGQTQLQYTFRQHGTFDATLFSAGAADDTQRRGETTTATTLEPESLRLEMGSQAPPLQELSLRGTTATDATLAAAVAKWPDLRRLDVSGCNISSLATVAKLPKLQEFRAARCRLAVTPDFVGSLRAVPQLELLDLSSCPGVTGDALVELSKGCRMLYSLELSDCPKLSDAGMLALATANPGIQHLSLALNPESISDIGASRVVRCVKRVRSLDFAGCTSLHIFLPTNIARYCEYLEDVSLASVKELRDEDLRMLFARCVYLKRVDISGCVAVTEETLIDILPHARRLEKLVLNMLPISDAGLAQLRADLPRCALERHVGGMVDPNDLSGVLGSATYRRPKAKARARASRRSSSARQRKKSVTNARW